MNGCNIPLSMKVGGMRIPHANGIVVHGKVVAGENLTMFQQVTIGVIEKDGSIEKPPRIGNNVYIGAGAKVLGNIVIGDDVKIGANAIITTDVPSNTTVVGYNHFC